MNHIPTYACPTNSPHSGHYWSDNKTGFECNGVIRPRLYISGPITGLPDLNKPAFAEATDKLRGAGYTVLNPHVICTLLEEHECQQPCTPSELMLPWADYLRADLVAMLQGADALAMLPGWVNSRGALLEFQVAEALGWEVRPWEEWL